MHANRTDATHALRLHIGLAVIVHQAQHLPAGSSARRALARAARVLGDALDELPELTESDLDRLSIATHPLVLPARNPR